MAKAKSTKQLESASVGTVTAAPAFDSNKLAPLEHVRRVLVPLYFSAPIKGWHSVDKQTELPPLAAFVLAIMAIEQVANVQGIEFRLWGNNSLSKREASIAAEIGIEQLLALKLIRPAAKTDSLAIETRDRGVWSMPSDARLVITAAGAKRIAFLAGSLLSVSGQELAKSLPTDSKEWAKKLPAPMLSPALQSQA